LCAKGQKLFASDSNGVKLERPKFPAAGTPANTLVSDETHTHARVKIFVGSPLVPCIFLAASVAARRRPWSHWAAEGAGVWGWHDIHHGIQFMSYLRCSRFYLIAPHMQRMTPEMDPLPGNFELLLTGGQSEP